MSAPSLLTPYGYSSSSCGYCAPSGSRSSGPTSKKYGMEAPQMTCDFYQSLIDRGWRRSGDFVYHPDMARTCCPQYTIRLDITEFKATKKHRQVINRFNRYLDEGEKPGESSTGQAPAVKGGKGKDKASGWDFVAELKKHEEGWGISGSKHKYTTQLVPAKATSETFELYKKYQVAVHKDPPEKVSTLGFSRFLCDSPLSQSSIPYRNGADIDKLPQKYGSYHLLYRIDDELVGISVIDILPLCVSSVYFIWNPDYAWASLGKLSALRELALARDIRKAGAEQMGWVYMGYWVPGCGKMMYKSEYNPSYLLDPDTNVFHLLTPKIEKFLISHPTGYYPFGDIEAGHAATSEPSAVERDGEGDDADMQDLEELDDFPLDHTPGWADPTGFDEDEIDGLLVLIKGGGFRSSRVVPVEALQFRDKAIAEMQIRELVAALGIDLMGRAELGVEGLKSKGVLFFG